MCFITPAACSLFVVSPCEERTYCAVSHTSMHAHNHVLYAHALCCCIHRCCRDRKWREPYHLVITLCWWWSSDHGQRERWKHSDSENRTLSQPNRYTPVHRIDNQNRKQSYSVCSPHTHSLHVNLCFLLQSVMIKKNNPVYVKTCTASCVTNML